MAAMTGTDTAQSNPSTSASAAQSNPSTDLSGVSLTDIHALLLGMKSETNSKLDHVSNQINNLTESVASLQEKVRSLNEEVHELKGEVQELRETNSELQERLKRSEMKLEDLESRSRRNNIVVHGLKPVVEGHETWEHCEQALQSMFRDKLGIEEELVLDRAHRMRHGDSNSPIVARFAFFKDRERVLKLKQKLKNTKIFVGEDFSKSVREIRRKLSPFLKKAKQDGARCRMVFDHLMINGKRFEYDPSADDIVEAVANSHD